LIQVTVDDLRAAESLNRPPSAFPVITGPGLDDLSEKEAQGVMIKEFDVEIQGSLFWIRRKENVLRGIYPSQGKSPASAKMLKRGHQVTSSPLFL
jgi:hypothetical protein